ncbi:nicotinamide mononucleotide adenylyltransferase isoform X2 [Rhodnius prolixus]|uniref:nicotinamide mononucleotide adenylyltransferase isoform X2 n=1 Tax=Rhodnius prolixus TaxID=13249 RepID=UPI003D18D58A
MTQSKIVLLSCGSYNPPTNMHLRMFEIARDQLNRQGRFHVIGGIISPVHDNYGKKELISSTHRCALVRLALQDSDWIHLSDWECNQEGWLPTRQVLQYHQNKLNSCLNSNEMTGNKRSLSDSDVPQWIQQAQKFCQNNMSSIKVKLLCGGDLLESFGTPGLWKDCDIENIVGDHGLAVITRAGTDPLKFIYESDVLTKYQNNISLITEWISNEVSSTKIRRALRRGESVKYLLSNQLIDYIKNNGLYSALDNKYDGSSVLLTPSPNDVIMSTIDVPDTGSETCMPAVKRLIMYVGCDRQPVNV